MANNEAVGAGIVLIIIAGIGFVYPINEQGWTIPFVSDLCTSGLGQIGQLFSGDVQQICQMYRYLSYGIYGSGLIGIILIIVGALVPSEKHSKYMCGKCNFESSYKEELFEHIKSKHGKQDVKKDNGSVYFKK